MFVVGPVTIPATHRFIVGHRGATVLGRDGARVGTPEHLLAALWGRGVLDARLVLSGAEVPALDGSAAPWLDAIDEAGVVAGPQAVVKRVARPVEVALGGGVARLTPAAVRRVSVQVDFGPGGPAGAAAVELGSPDFDREIAPARTFVLARDVERLRAEGRGGGATPENTVVWPASALRFPDEPVRHKLLDLVGDLALCGVPVMGAIEVVRGSHALHHRLVRALAPGCPPAFR